MKEQRNLASTTSKRTYVHKVNRTPKDPTHQSKGFKRIESFKPFNRRRRPNRGSNHNTLFKDDDDKAFKDVETKFKSNSNPKLKSFTYVIKNFDLNNNKSNCSISSLNFKNNIENFETEDSYLITFNKSKKLLKQSPNKPDLLLYDISTTDYIVNDKKWFRNDYTFNKGQLKTLKIGKSLVILKDNSTAVFIVIF